MGHLKPKIFVTVSTGHFDPLIEECQRLSDRYEFSGQIGSSRVVPTFRHFRTGPPEKIVDWMAGADLVISHAGTGMLSMLYRLRKPAIVVPKQVRYGEANDMQVELAQKWAALGLAVLCLDVEKLSSGIEEALKHPWRWTEFASLGRRLDTLCENI